MKTFSTILFVIFFAASSLTSEEVELKVRIKNGTTGKDGSIESLRLIALQQGMIPVREMGAASGSFTIPKTSVPDQAPLLLQVKYAGVSYNKMIPPVPVMRSGIQEVIVYEKTKDKSLVRTRSAMQITRGRDFLRVFKIFLISNNTIPPKSYQDEQNPFEIFVPSEATEVVGQLTQGESKMAIPLQLQDGPNGKYLDRALLPGSSELQISYTIPASNLSTVTFKDRMLAEKEEGFRAVFSKPADMEVSFLGANKQERIQEDAPADMRAFKVGYPAPRYELSISVSGGAAVEMETERANRKIENGTWFPTTERSLLGLTAVLGFLFTLSFVFVYRKK
ncbi:hypothetical protein EHQ12_16890 [Leptospira gomenensis]|uniref:Uncharacterized protein n=1 Tax=Leptospira gomenensis TaxID=2484974 RepID=A0A5F1Y7S3_9LEPT|nr:hypothetical protein [Leptospira gomenensis]TGK29498.1 hypothetical protein EHQ17_16130 [Leptospira gomenensis]TGK33896.1 hypothetical protein EHQ12_16890 [Leptospira gomenensis]TGK44840.1 hypothetical protein EHQ07_11160 [Leptospira gomenensis]TGK64459.1 hypothetical protein EHQ13_07240 [Leptospira gomenensis]